MFLMYGSWQLWVARLAGGRDPQRRSVVRPAAAPVDVDSHGGRSASVAVPLAGVAHIAEEAARRH